MNWEKLSQREKAELMKLYLKGGVLKLSEMKKHYNSFANGGPTEKDIKRDKENRRLRHNYIRNDAELRSVVARLSKEYSIPAHIIYSNLIREGLLDFQAQEPENIQAYYNNKPIPNSVMNKEYTSGYNDIGLDRIGERGTEKYQPKRDIIFALNPRLNDKTKNGKPAPEEIVSGDFSNVYDAIESKVAWLKPLYEEAGRTFSDPLQRANLTRTLYNSGPNKTTIRNNYLQTIYPEEIELYDNLMKNIPIEYSINLDNLYDSKSLASMTRGYGKDEARNNVYQHNRDSRIITLDPAKPVFNNDKLAKEKGAKIVSVDDYTNTPKYYFSPIRDWIGSSKKAYTTEDIKDNAPLFRDLLKAENFYLSDYEKVNNPFDRNVEKITPLRGK